MRKKAVELVISGLEELNEDLGLESLKNPNEDTSIFGGPGSIDSLSLVTLIVAIEGETEECFGQRVALADEKAMSQRNSPYRSVGALADFIVSRLKESES